MQQVAVVITATGTGTVKKLMMTLRRDIIGGMHEDINITNHHQLRVDVQLMLATRPDFVDVFRVKAQKLVTEGRMNTTWNDNVFKKRLHSS
jgi:hypothetical protein